MTWVVTMAFDIDADRATIVTWGDRFDQHDASITPEPDGGVSVTVWVDDAHDVFDAQQLAHKIVHNVFTADPTGVGVLPEEAYLQEADAPTLPEMVSAPEVGDVLGVSRQRVYQLPQTGGFPEPLYRFRTGPVWDARAIDAFASTWDRRPGPKGRKSAPKKAPASRTVRTSAR